MASPTLPPPEAPPKRVFDPRDSAIDKRIRQTRWQLKLNDFATGSIALIAGVLGYLFIATLADHWIVPGGLGFRLRLMLFLGLVAGAGWYCFRVLFPPLLHQVNPIFAAKTLEQARPSLKNGLINLLLLRREGGAGENNPLAERVLAGLQASTANEVAQIPAEVAVDRIHLIRRSYVLVGLVALSAAYLVLSPKSPVPSFGRVLWPWARIAAPSRVQIEQIKPGDATVFQGRSVTVSAAVEGLRSGEEVHLLYSTDDGQMVDQVIPMEPGEGLNRFACKLPPSKAGLQQSLRYHLAAGDCTSFEYTIQMEVPPTIVVDTVRYTYPPYTGLPERVTTSAADIRAIEGTRITIEATANREIGWANVEMDGRTDQRVRMRSNGRQALGEFTLRLPQDGSEGPGWYQLRFAESESGENRENIDPVRHRIEVFADRPPKVRLVDAPLDNATVPLDATVEMRVEASDPDFALSRVAVLAERDGRPLAIPLLLDRTDTGRGYEGPFDATCRFEPLALGLRVGDEVQYRAVAEDNRQPERNRSETDPRWMKIGPPDRGQQGNPGEQQRSPSSEPDGQQRPGQTPQDQDQNGEGSADESQKPEMGGETGEQEQQGSEAGEGAKSEKQQPGEQGEDKSGDGSEGESGEQSQKPGEDGSQSDKANPDGKGEEQQKGGKREQPLDQETNAADAFNEILKQREKEMQESGEQPQDGKQPQESPESKPSEQPETGEGEPAGKPEAGPQSEDAKEHEGESDVPPNRSEQGGAEGEKEGSEPPQDMKGQGGTPDGTSGSESQQQGPETESDASGGKPNGKPGEGKGSEDAETKEGGKATPEDLENGEVESMGKKPADPKDGKNPEFSQQPQPGSPEPGQPTSDKPGQDPKDLEPTPMPQEANQPNAEKPTGGKTAEEEHKTEGSSPSTSKKQSKQDQREPAKGDRSGDGGEGGGQDSDRKGLGNPGSSTPDKQGGQPGGEKGEDETGPGAGDKVPTDQPTGNQAKQPGGKSQGQSDSQGKTPSQQPQQDPQASPSQNSDSQQQPSNDNAEGTPSGDPAQRGQQAPTGRQRGGTGDQQGPGQGTDQDFGSEAANKEYAEKATNLALEYIEDQLDKDEPNQELLDRLGWTQDDLREFLQRWKKMKADARQTGPDGDDARQELDDALKSLGLRPARTSIQGGRIKTDSSIKSDSIRFAPPPAWRELTQEYTRSIASEKKKEK